MVASIITLAAALAPTAAAPTPGTDDFAPGLFIFAVCAVAVCLILVGIGVVIAAVMLALCAGLIGLGVLSLSAIAAATSRRWTVGVRVFIYQVLALAAAPCGVGLIWLSDRFYHLHLTHQDILVLGLIAGVAAGLSLAFVLDRLMRFILARAWRSKGFPVQDT